MHTLWSRATRSPGTCKCISCLSNPSAAVARRIRPTAVKGAWAFGTPTSTFVYTVIFAAGLAIDGGAKRSRNEQWDAAFAALNEELERATRRRDEKISSHKHKTVEDVTPARESFINAQLMLVDSNCTPLERIQAWSKRRLDWAQLSKAIGNELAMDEAPKIIWDIGAEDIGSDLLELLPYDSRFPGSRKLEWPANTGRPMDPNTLPPQSLWATDSARMRALRKRFIWKKVIYQEVAISLLVHSLLHRAFPAVGKHRDIPKELIDVLTQPIMGILSMGMVAFRQIQDRLIEHFRSIMNTYATVSADEIHKLQSKSREMLTYVPEYHQDEEGDFYETAAQMNDAIKKLLLPHKTRPNALELSIIVAKVCHNLLVSSAPPDVQTFNLLLTTFRRWNLGHMTDAVVIASLRCHIRPNEITCAAVLNHYISTQNPEGFVNYVQKMRGANRKALMLVHPQTKTPEERLIREKERKVILKVHPSPMVFNSIMHGTLRFAGFERAWEIYHEMKADGWGLDVLGLEHFLANCLYRADWEGAQDVWAEICTIALQSRKAHLEKAFATMLSISSVCGKKQAFNRLLQEIDTRRLYKSRILEAAKKTTRMAMATTQKETWGKEILSAHVNDVLDVVAGYKQDMKTEVVEETVHKTASSSPSEDQPRNETRDDFQRQEQAVALYHQEMFADSRMLTFGAMAA